MNSAPVWDKDLIHRYNQSGPRYTSYPTAVQFDGSFDIQKYRQNAQFSASSIKPLSLYFHIPFCSHVCYYCACNKIVTGQRMRSKVYLEYLFREIEMQSALFSHEQRVEQLHFGGGTPTFLSRGADYRSDGAYQPALSVDLQRYHGLLHRAGSKRGRLAHDEHSDGSGV